jgi:hypothetical protein
MTDAERLDALRAVLASGLTDRLKLASIRVLLEPVEGSEDHA